MAARITSAGNIILASKDGPRLLPGLSLPPLLGDPSPGRPGLAAVSDCTGDSFHRLVYLFLGVAHRVLGTLAGCQHLGDLAVNDGVALVPAWDLGPEPDVLRLAGFEHRGGRHYVRHVRERILVVLYLGHLVDGVTGRRPSSHRALEVHELRLWRGGPHHEQPRRLLLVLRCISVDRDTRPAVMVGASRRTVRQGRVADVPLEASYLPGGRELVPLRTHRTFFGAERFAEVVPVPARAPGMSDSDESVVEPRCLYCLRAVEGGGAWIGGAEPTYLLAVLEIIAAVSPQ